MGNILRRLFADEDGATVVEYGVLLALIIAGLVAVIFILGNQIQQGLADFNEAFQEVKSGS